jgi:predicted nucleic acid-binding protein
VKVLGIDEDTAEFYATILDGLRRKGNPIPTNDIWIASVAFQYGFPLFTKDRHFEQIPGLVLVP